jgi:hypothetical protein
MDLLISLFAHNSFLCELQLLKMRFESLQLRLVHNPVCRNEKNHFYSPRSTPLFFLAFSSVTAVKLVRMRPVVQDNSVNMPDNHNGAAQRQALLLSDDESDFFMSPDARRQHDRPPRLEP